MMSATANIALSRRAHIPQFARQARAGVLALREQEFVMACRALGVGHGRILFRQILPNALGPLGIGCINGDRESRVRVGRGVGKAEGCISLKFPPKRGIIPAQLLGP